MATNVSNNQSEVEIQEKVIQDSGSGVEGSEMGSQVERRERVKVVRDHGGERHEHVVEDIGAERRARLGKVAQFVWLMAGLLEALLGLRFVLKLIAANPSAPFAQLIYGFTDLFLWPFHNLTPAPAAQGMVLETSTLIAMIVYAVLAWVVVKLVYLIFMPSKSRTVSVYQHDKG